VDSDEQYEFLKNLLDVIGSVEVSRQKQERELREALMAQLDATNNWLREIAGLLDMLQTNLGRIADRG
jgi:hypothetical protein